jgi:hypothetical protein
VREELQAEVDQLPEAGPQEGRALAGGRGPHHPSPFDARQQVRARISIHTSYMQFRLLC